MTIGGSGGTGTATVSGGDSKLIALSQIDVINGNMTVDDHASVRTSSINLLTGNITIGGSNTLFTAIHGVVVGVDPGNNGTLDISGGASVITGHSTTSGTPRQSAAIAIDDGSVGTVNVQGTGTSWQMSGHLFMGGNEFPIMGFADGGDGPPQHHQQGPCI